MKHKTTLKQRQINFKVACLNNHIFKPIRNKQKADARTRRGFLKEYRRSNRQKNIES